MAQRTNPPSISAPAGPGVQSATDDVGNGPPSAGARILASLCAEFRRVFRRTPLARLKIRRDRRLRLRETLSLGERRLVAILECDSREYLVAATGQTVSLLAPLEPPAAAGAPVVAELRRATRAGG